MTVLERNRILLCVATKKGLSVLTTALNFLDTHQFYVCTFEEKHVSNRYDAQIRELAVKHGCELITLKQFREELLAVVMTRQITSIMCIGWKFLVPSEVGRALKDEVIVAHDSLLPKFRGFAPLPTAMVVGECETGVTYLRIGNGVDNGEILWQSRVPINSEDTIERMIEKLLPMYSEGAALYFQGELSKGVVQEESQATYSIWRDELDYRIDWNLDAETIERTIRALGPPYLGAQSLLADRCSIIHRATVQTDLTFAIRQPGKVWSLDSSGRPTVICGCGLLRIDEATVDGESLIPLKTLRVRFK